MDQEEEFSPKTRENFPESSPLYPGPTSFLPSDAERLKSHRQNQLIWTFMAIGLLARCVRYFLRFPLWEDECFLCVNFIDRGYLDLLEPLQPHQVAPVLFLWIELTMVKLFGYNELSLRLFAFLSSIGSLFLFRHVAGRLLNGTTLVLAVGTFAMAYPGIRYAAEAKQYGSDMLVGLIFLSIAVEFWRSIGQIQNSASPYSNTTESLTQKTKYFQPIHWLWLLNFITPFAIGVSYPAVFAAGGTSLFLGWMILKASTSVGQSFKEKLQSTFRNPISRPWLCFNIVLLCSFSLLLFAAKSQKNAELDWMGGYWSNTFPPLAKPSLLPSWFLTIHTGDLLAFPIGGGRGASTLTFITVSLALILFFRSRRFTIALLLLAPPALNLLAAALHRYPYGGHVKFSQYMAGSICILSAIGSAVILTYITHRWKHGNKVLAMTMTYLMLIGSGSIARDLSNPYKSKTDMRARAFARWFWFNTAFEGEVACVSTDLKKNFSPETITNLSWETMYRCNKRIYSPQQGKPPQLDRVSSKWPLRCVLFKVSNFKFDDSAFDKWMQEMESRYTLVSTETYAFPRFPKGAKTAGNVDYLETYKFIPRNSEEIKQISNKSSKEIDRQ